MIVKKVERQSKEKFNEIIARSLLCAWSRGEDYVLTRADSSTCKRWVSTEIRKGSVTTKPFGKKRRRAKDATVICTGGFSRVFVLVYIELG